MNHIAEQLKERATTLLNARPRLWQTLTGTVGICSHDDLLDIGRGRFHGQEHPTRESLVAVPPGQRAISERRHRFWATADPCQLRIEPIGPSRRTSILIVNRFRWWSRRGHRVRSGNCTPDAIRRELDGSEWAVYDDTVLPAAGLGNASPGVEDLDILLKPESLTHAFTFTRARDGQARGRPAILVDAQPQAGDAFYLGAKGLAALETSGYSLGIDAECGIILEANAFIGGDVAQRHVLGDLRVDEPLDPELFTAPGWDAWPLS